MRRNASGGRWGLVMLIGGASAAAAQTQLIHHYQFTSGAQDSAGSAHGVLVNGAQILNGALEVRSASQQYVQFGGNLVPLSGSFSVCFFARAYALPNDYFEIISQGHSGGVGFYVGMHKSGNIRAGDSWYTTTPYPTDGQWHHVAVTMDALLPESRLYIDGVLRQSLADDIVVSGTTPTRFGRQFDPFFEFFDGLVDDMRIYTGALSPAQVSQLAACYPDCNADSVLTVADFGCFQTRFVAAASYADCNEDGALTVADFGCFQTKFVAGCP